MNAEPQVQTEVATKAETDELSELERRIQLASDPIWDPETKGLRHTVLVDHVLDLGPIAAGPGKTLWKYENGVWLADADGDVTQRTVQIVGDRWRPSHADQVLKDLRSRPPFITDEQPTDFINCRNGLLDWRTGELHPHRSDVPTTYQLAVDWDPNATCPTFDQWLSEVAPEDAIDLVHEVIGVAVYPDQPIQKAVLVLGPGRNGKTTLLNLVGELIGPEHVARVDFRTLSNNRFAPAQLFGKVANISGDLDTRSVENTSTFKQVTGRDLIYAERKGGQPFSFRSRATMLYAANAVPGSADRSTGFLERWVVIPFTKFQATGDVKPDLGLPDRLSSELPGVLVKAVDGLRRAMQRGEYTLPPSVVEAIEEHGEAVDPLRRFAKQCLVVTGSDDDYLERKIVYDVYKKWCDEEGVRPIGNQKFWSALRELNLGLAADLDSDRRRIAGGVRRVVTCVRFSDDVDPKWTWVP